jgi:hypothetical protein
VSLLLCDLKCFLVESFSFFYPSTTLHFHPTFSSNAENDKPIEVNIGYRPLPISKLTKLDYWEHFKAEILLQGRSTYFEFDPSVLNNIKADDDDDSSSEGDETDVTNNDIKPEIPIPLFAACSGDRLTNDVISPWTIRLSDVLQTPLVLLQSNIWPGSFTFVKNR